MPQAKSIVATLSRGLPLLSKKETSAFHFEMGLEWAESGSKIPLVFSPQPHIFLCFS